MGGGQKANAGWGAGEEGRAATKAGKGANAHKKHDGDAADRAGRDGPGRGTAPQEDANMMANELHQLHTCSAYSTTGHIKLFGKKKNKPPRAPNGR